MTSKAVVGLKPNSDNNELLELTKSVLHSGGSIHLVSFVLVGADEDELMRVKEVKKRVEVLVSALEQAGYSASMQVEVAVAGIGGALARVAEQQQADLLVIGLTKRSRVGKALLGSDAQAALMSANCPVLTTRLD